MQENEFEKQVRHKMDEFRVHPSDPVWLGIREELRRKKRRRLLFIPLFAMLLVAGYFGRNLFLTPDKHAVSTSAIPVSVDTKTAGNTTPGNEAKTKTGIEQKSDDQHDDGISTVKEKELTEKKNDLSINHKKQNVPGEKMTSVPGKTIGAPGNITTVQHSRRTKTDNNAEKDIAVMVNKRTKINQTKETKPVIDNADAFNTGGEQPKNEPETSLIADDFEKHTTSPDNNPVSVIFRVREINSLPDSIVSGKVTGVQLPLLKNPKTFNTPGNWKMGFVFSTGFATRKEKLIDLSLAEEGKSATPNSNYAGQSSGPGNPGRGVLVAQPSAVKAGFAFKAGVMAMKPLSKRFDVSAGIAYSFSSDHIEIGNSISTYVNQIDALAVAYNSNTGNSSKKINYTNKYHFIELPVNVYFNIWPKWKTPLVWNAGVAVSRLISSNVLLYDAALGGIYYRGNEDLNKTQFSVSTGFAFRFGTNRHLQWSMGPQIYLNTTKLFQSAYDKNNHSVYGGLNVQVLFPAGKKHKSNVF